MFYAMTTIGAQSNEMDGLGRTASNPLVVGPTVPTVIRPILIIGPQTAVAVRPGQRDVVNIGPTMLLVRPAIAVQVEPPPRAAWDDRGWTAEQDGPERVYRGWYNAANRRTGQALRFEGRITQRGQHITPYIADPPPEIRRHPKAACFTVTQAPWFQVHWRRPAANIDDCLLYIERVLDEAINRHH